MSMNTFLKGEFMKMGFGKGDSELSRMDDARIAVEKYGWKWVRIDRKRKILLPPDDDERRHWTAVWDEKGIPHYLPRYSEGEE